MAIFFLFSRMGFKYYPNFIDRKLEQTVLGLLVKGLLVTGWLLSSVGAEQ